MKLWAWRVACWCWVGLPILGFIPGNIPLRLSSQWLALLVSLGVIGLGVAVPRRAGAVTGFGWTIVGCLLIAMLNLRHATEAVTWACQTILILTAAAFLVQSGEWRWLREAVVVCAWVQVIVCGLQRFHVELPWPVQPTGHLGGTVGSKTPAAVLMALGSLWSTNWSAGVLAGCSLWADSATAAPIACLRLVSPALRGSVWRMGVLSLGAWAGLAWFPRLAMRWDIWHDWRLSLWGVGFSRFPGGFQDDTVLGRALGWRDYHNVYLDVLGRFGVAGIVGLGLLGWWLWTRSAAEPRWRWTLAFAAWVGCWQSLEQFPVLIVLILVWWIGVEQDTQHNGGRSDALDSVQTVAVLQPDCAPRSAVCCDGEPVLLGRESGRDSEHPDSGGCGRTLEPAGGRAERV